MCGVRERRRQCEGDADRERRATRKADAQREQRERRRGDRADAGPEPAQHHFRRCRIDAGRKDQPRHEQEQRPSKEQTARPAVDRQTDVIAGVPVRESMNADERRRDERERPECGDLVRPHDVHAFHPGCHLSPDGFLELEVLFDLGAIEPHRLEALVGKQCDLIAHVG